MSATSVNVASLGDGGRRSAVENLVERDAPAVAALDDVFLATRRTKITLGTAFPKVAGAPVPRAR